MNRTIENPEFTAHEINDGNRSFWEYLSRPESVEDIFKDMRLTYEQAILRRNNGEGIEAKDTQRK